MNPSDKNPFFTTLAIDTAGEILSLGLEAETGCWYFEADAGLRHSELLMDCIGMLLDRAGIKPGGISGIVCMGGPGSFTGLRIAFAAAKGLGLALGIPFAPVPSLDCMAQPYAAWPGIIAPVIDAKRNSFFCALYRSGKRISGYMDAEPGQITQAINVSLEEGETVLVTGNDAEKAALALPPQLVFVDKQRRGYARSLLGIAKNGEIFNNYSTDWLSGPEYIRGEPVTRDGKIGANKI